MSATNVESLTNPRDSLPNVYTNITAREIDFVTRFGDNWEALRNILGIMRPIRKAPGTQLVTYKATIALESGNVDAGEVIPYSKSSIVEAAKGDITIEKYAKAVPIEDVAKYGAEIAVEKSDDAFLTTLQNVTLNKFYTFLKTGELTAVCTTWQDALAKAQGEVLNKFQSMQKDCTEVVGFANILDAYAYLGAAGITVQTQFGISYIKDFLGYGTLFLLPNTVLDRNYVIALPVENIDLYYIDPSDSEFARLGLQYTVQGETNLIGFHAQGNYTTAVGESYALMGMALWAEYIDGIAVVKVEASGSLGSIANTSTSAYATGETGDATVTVPTTHSVAGGKYYFKAQASTAPAAPTYLAQFDTTGWVAVENGDVVHTTNGHKYRIVEVNGTGQAIADANGTVVAKT